MVIDMRKRTFDKTINPSAGFTVNANIDLEKNDSVDTPKKLTGEKSESVPKVAQA